MRLFGLRAKRDREVEVVVAEVQPAVEVRARAAASAEPSLAGLADRLTLLVPRHPLEEQVEVVGETYRAKDIKRVFRERNRPIGATGATLQNVECILVPEPWNPQDSNAVAVMVGRHHVGYLAADLAGGYAESLNRLAGEGFLVTGEARIWAKTDAA